MDNSQKIALAYCLVVSGAFNVLGKAHRNRKKWIFSPLWHMKVLLADGGGEFWCKLLGSTLHCCKHAIKQVGIRASGTELMQASALLYRRQAQVSHLGAGQVQPAHEFLWAGRRWEGGQNESVGVFLWAGWPGEWGGVWIWHSSRIQIPIPKPRGANSGHCSPLRLVPAK